MSSNVPISQKTSLITILSSVHGRLRREQRDIDKRDLQKAVKYGTRTLQRGFGRYQYSYKIEYDGVTFVVDESLQFEITSYPSRLEKAPVDAKQDDDHHKAVHILKQRPDRCSSHTVLVIDNSGSMQISDIPRYRDRQHAAYEIVALEFVAEQLLQQTANNRDVVSLVEFNETATVVFEREPCSWLLYNRLLSRIRTGRYKERQRIRHMESYRADSNYLPALTSADTLLEKDHHDGCALALFFLSDGEPSDAREHYWTTLYAQSQICGAVSDMASKYGQHLRMSLVGFGNESRDFSTMQAMCDACNKADGLATAEFVYCEKMTHSIGSALTSLTTSLTQLRTSLMGKALKSDGQMRNVASEKETGTADNWQFFKIVDHKVFTPRGRRMVYLPDLPAGAVRDTSKRKPPFLAMNASSFGQGAERVAFRCFLSESMSPTGLVHSVAMVAKETILVHHMDENVAFHKAFCETQSLASFLADEFNMRIRATPSYDAATTPVISFLPCSVLVLKDETVSGGTKGVLVEKLLDSERFGWCKWNDNGGGVDGKAFHAPLDIEYELQALEGTREPVASANRLEALVEEDSEDESDEDSVEDEGLSREDFEDLQDCQKSCDNTTAVSPNDYLQAFSHFTYCFTNKKVLVCDLQGVYNTDMSPPTFELTDPAIHYRSKRGRRMVYGRTDKGMSGMQLFLNTHTCTDLCKVVNLSKREKYWHKLWYKHHDEVHPDAKR